MRGEEAAKPGLKGPNPRRHQRLGFVVARQCHSSGRPSKAMNTPGRTLHSRCQTHPPATRQAGGNSCRFDRLAALLRQGSGGRPASRLSAGPVLRSSERAKQDGGARRDRTDDLMLAKHALYQLSYGPQRRIARKGASLVSCRPIRGSCRGRTLRCGVVGPGRLELPTSRLSGVCSNQLSYRPSDSARDRAAASNGQRRSGKRNEDGGVSHLFRCLRRPNRPKGLDGHP